MNTFNYDYFYEADHDPALQEWLQTLAATVEVQSNPSRHGHFPGWLQALHSLPEFNTKKVDLNHDRVSAWSVTADELTRKKIHTELMKLSPWRKGPFQINELFIDSEWRSHCKWDRIKNHLSPLNNRNVLDVGCGNGYYGYRMLGAGARSVVGVDPGELFCTQFAAINHFVKSRQLAVLPLTGEMVFDQPYLFDTVFSMGVVSHRREPEEHLRGLLSCLRPGGELVLETLVIDSDEATLLVPNDRYANMRNVWKLPSVPLLVQMLEDTGFSGVRCVDCSRTTIDEQRSTEWMPSFSLVNGLNPDDHSLTREGYPAPTRCVIVATKPGRSPESAS